MKYDVVKVDDNNFVALDSAGEFIIASTDSNHKTKHNVPLMKKEWFKDVCTSIELETIEEPIFKPCLVDGIGLAYNITESLESIKTDKDGFAILIKVHF